jgi:hypothetical protein
MQILIPWEKRNSVDATNQEGIDMLVLTYIDLNWSLKNTNIEVHAQQGTVVLLEKNGDGIVTVPLASCGMAGERTSINVPIIGSIQKH